jgi:tetratricopeptide (TPR) repeat protein
MNGAAKQENATTKRKNCAGVFRMPVRDSRRLFSAPILLFAVLTLFAVSLVSCVSSAAKAEEYYALGTAYFELQKYAEAENYFNKAKFHKKTKIASEYNLGRIAYETGRYEEAEAYFDRIISADSENITALKAAAYTCIKLEDLERAEVYYRRILNLEPESYDQGYNYALVLSALGKHAEAEQILLKYNDTENPGAWLVLARVQKYQEKPEAADSYSASLLKKDDPEVRAEYAVYLESIGLAAKALEEYRKVLENSELAAERKEEITKTIERLEAGGSEADGKGSTEAE